MSIELHIERLVMDEAVLGGERAADVRAAIERELMRQLARPGAIDTVRALGAVAAVPPVTLPTAAQASERLGSRIAAATRQGLGLAHGTRRSP